MSGLPSLARSQCAQPDPFASCTVSILALCLLARLAYKNESVLRPKWRSVAKADAANLNAKFELGGA